MKTWQWIALGAIAYLFLKKQPAAANGGLLANGGPALVAEPAADIEHADYAPIYYA